MGLMTEKSDEKARTTNLASADQNTRRVYAKRTASTRDRDQPSRRRSPSPPAASSSASSPSSGGVSIGMLVPIVVTAVEELFPGSGSGVDEVAVAVFTRLPDDTVTFTTIDRVADAPTPSVPTAPETVPGEPGAGPAQVPGTARQETNVVPAGSGSSMTTATAGSGPALTTRIM
jgi:hypothetical protein